MLFNRFIIISRAFLLLPDRRINDNFQCDCPPICNNNYCHPSASLSWSWARTYVRHIVRCFLLTLEIQVCSLPLTFPPVSVFLVVVLNEYPPTHTRTPCLITKLTLILHVVTQLLSLVHVKQITKVKNKNQTCPQTPQDLFLATVKSHAADNVIYSDNKFHTIKSQCIFIQLSQLMILLPCLKCT